MYRKEVELGTSDKVTLIVEKEREGFSPLLTIEAWSPISSTRLTPSEMISIIEAFVGAMDAGETKILLDRLVTRQLVDNSWMPDV